VESHTVSEYGEADAFGHKKKTDIGQALGDEIRKRTGNEIMLADLTYELRSGEPDSTDQIVAITFGNIAADLIRAETFGRLVALEGGKYTHVELPDPKLGRENSTSRSCTTSRAFARTSAENSARRCCSTSKTLLNI